MAQKITVYGIKNCDTMKKTFRFLDEHAVDYEFVDYKKAAPSEKLLSSFLDKTSLDKLVNKRGTTFRKLSDEEKAEAENPTTALPLLSQHSSMIKRPIISFPDGEILLGFQKEDILEKIK